MRLKPTFQLNLAGFLIFLAWLALATFSHCKADLDVWVFLAIMAVAWLGFVCAWRPARKLEPETLLPVLWLWAVLFRLAGFWGEPVLENDFYRYLWDGRQFAVTGNPYVTAPADHFSQANLPAAFTSILDGINYPQVRTIYGPVTEAAFALSYLVAPAQLWPLKLLLLAADLLTLWLLLRLVKPSNALLYAWCPLLIKETAFTAHPDTLAIFLLVWALYAYKRGQRGGMAVALALAVGAKVFAVLLVPFLLCQTGKKAWLIFVGVLGAVYLPFWLQGSTADLAGLSAFVKRWEFNSSVHGLLSWAAGSAAAKLVCALLFLTAGRLYFWRWRSTPSGNLPRGDIVFGVFFLFSATVNAWYLLWLLPFIALVPSVVGVTALAMVTMSYISGLNLGNANQVGHHLAWVRPVEYGAMLLALLVDWRRLCRTRVTSSPELFPDMGSGSPASGSFLVQTMVLIPALNEAECIAQTVRYWKQLGVRFVRVVDNGSTDLTAQAARQAGADVVAEPKRGYGAAACRGLQNPPAEAAWVLFSSADGSDHLSLPEIQEWQRCIDRGYQMILGDRFGPRESRQHLKVVQSYGNRLCCWLIALGWRRRFNDMGSLRLVRIDALERLALQDRGFAWNIEMQVRAVKHGLPIAELPVGYFPRRAGQSKISGTFGGTLRAGWGILRMILKLWWTKNSQPKAKIAFSGQREALPVVRCMRN